MQLKASLLACVATLGWATLGWTGSALAQSAETTAQEHGAQEDGAASYGDIVVTANKREQNLKDVGATITAFSGDQLKQWRVSSAEDLASAVPGLVFSLSTANTPVFTLRGIGFNEAALAVYPAVSVYQDEAPLPFPVLASHAAFDLERVEVLKGPQGTLFGQNSTGGAINYIVARPTNHLDAGVDLTYGRFNQAEMNFHVSGPLSDTIRARVSGVIHHMDDWQKNPFRSDRLGEENYYAGRLLLEADASERLRFNLAVNGWIDQSDPQAQQYAVFQPQAPRTPDNLLNYPFVPTGDARLADWSPEYRPRSDRRFWQGTLRADWEVTDAIRLTSLTSYSDFSQEQVTDGDGLALSSYDLSPNDGDIWTFNQELRLASNGSGPLTWVVGGNYSKSRVTENQVLHYPESAVSNPGNLNIYQSGIYTDQKMRDVAVFGNVEYAVTSALVFKGGARYTNSRRDARICGYDAGDGRINSLFTIIGRAFGNPDIPALVDGDCYSVDDNFIPGAPFRGRLSEDNVSWRAGIDYKASRDLLLYANVSRGFKGGSYPTVAAATFAQLAPVTQEKLTAYEAGFKFTALGGAAQLNAAGFYYDYRDKQVRGKLKDPLFNLLDVLVNVPRSRVIGAEAELTLRPVEGLTVSGAATYLDSKVKQYSGYDVLGQVRDFNGIVLPYTPRWTYSMNVDYRVGLVGDLTGVLGAKMTGRTVQDGVFDAGRLSPVSAEGVPPSRVVDGIAHPYRIPGHTIFDFRAGIETGSGLSVTAWAKNAFNKYYITNIIPGSNTSSRYAGRPATYGVTIGYKY